MANEHRVRDALCPLIVTGSGIAFLVNFIMLAQGGGELRVYEHNRVVLALETIGAVAMIIFGIHEWLQVVRQKPPQEGK